MFLVILVLVLGYAVWAFRSRELDRCVRHHRAGITYRGVCVLCRVGNPPAGRIYIAELIEASLNYFSPVKTIF